jgi:hypothetical protein
METLEAIFFACYKTLLSYHHELCDPTTLIPDIFDVYKVYSAAFASGPSSWSLPDATDEDLQDLSSYFR